MRDINMYDIVVIGAGLAGTYTVLELAKTRPELKILLLDAGPEIISKRSSSFNECYKLHTGAHYLGDRKTAKHCLISSVSFARESPDYILGSPGDPWRKGRHYVMSNSLFGVKDAKAVCEELAETYQDLVNKDPRNKVFGEPDQFIRYLKPDEYPNVAGSIPFTDQDGNKQDIHVKLGIETPESQINIHKLKADLQRQIEECENITFLPNRKVKRVSRLANEIGFSLQAENSNDAKEESSHTYTAKLVANCAWESIERLNKQLGLYIPDGRIIRLKVSIVVDLPEDLRNENTCIFSVGPYCSFTNQGDGTAILTAERITNVGYFRAGTDLNDLILTEDNIPIKKFMGGLSTTEGRGKDLSENILQECADYFPSLENATIREVRVGYVKMADPEGTYSIYDSQSPIHSRRENGVAQEKDLGFLSNAAMKMTYARDNAREMCRLIDRNYASIGTVIEIIKIVEGEIKARDKRIRDLFLYHIFRGCFIDQVTLCSTDSREKFFVGKMVENFTILAGKKKKNVDEVLEFVKRSPSIDEQMPIEKIFGAKGIQKFLKKSPEQKESKEEGNSSRQDASVVTPLFVSPKKRPEIPRSHSSPALPPPCSQNKPCSVAFFNHVGLEFSGDSSCMPSQTLDTAVKCTT